MISRSILEVMISNGVNIAPVSLAFRTNIDKNAAPFVIERAELYLPQEFSGIRGWRCSGCSAHKLHAPLLSLDKGLKSAATQAGIKLLEVT